MNKPKQRATELIKQVNDSLKQQNAYLSQLKIDEKETLTNTQKII